MDERAIHVLMQGGVGGRWLVVAYCLSQGQAGAENDQLFFFYNHFNVFLFKWLQHSNPLVHCAVICMENRAPLSTGSKGYRPLLPAAEI